MKKTYITQKRKNRENVLGRCDSGKSLWLVISDCPRKHASVTHLRVASFVPGNVPGTEQCLLVIKTVLGF